MNIIANTAQLALVGGVMLVGARPALADDCDPNNGDYDCNDGLFCNGYERCLLVGDPGYDAEFLCVDGAPPNCIDGYACTYDYCSEERQSCVHEAPDDDGDGHRDMLCTGEFGIPFGDDCNDHDPDVYPGNIETCDALRKDEDCDPDTFGTKDSDGDGYIDWVCCNGGNCGTDCDDTRADVHPHNTDLCDGVDNDCNRIIDEDDVCPACAAELTLYDDVDGDGFGDPNAPAVMCAVGLAQSVYSNDCDDNNSSIHPGSMMCDDANKGWVYICNSQGEYDHAPCASNGKCKVLPGGTGWCA